MLAAADVTAGQPERGEHQHRDVGEPQSDAHGGSMAALSRLLKNAPSGVSSGQRIRMFW